MNILVCIKLISMEQFSDSLRETGDRLSAGKLDINPADLYALEMALRIKDRSPRTRVSVMTMAPDYAEYHLREMIAMGADRAVLISDKRIAGSDTYVTARVLAAAIRKEPKPDLILCGKKSLDSETGHVGPQLGMLLSYPFAANIVDFSVDGYQLRFLRAADDGEYRYEGTFPCILSVCNGNEMIRKATIQGTRKSKSASMIRYDIADLGIPEEKVGLRGSSTRTIETRNAVFRTVSNRMIRDMDQGVEELLLCLRKEAGS